MSHQAMTWAVTQRAGSPGHKAVLMAIANRAGVDDWACFPSQATIARETEQSERTVRRQLADLEAAGMIARDSRYRNGHRTSDRITVIHTHTGQSGQHEISYRTDSTFIPDTGGRAEQVENREVLTTADVFTRDEPEPVDSLSLDDVRRIREEARTRERVEQARLQAVPDGYRDVTEQRETPEATDASQVSPLLRETAPPAP